jgi:hypothetical protein
MEEDNKNIIVDQKSDINKLPSFKKRISNNLLFYFFSLMWAVFTTAFFGLGPLLALADSPLDDSTMQSLAIAFFVLLYIATLLIGIGFFSVTVVKLNYSKEHITNWRYVKTAIIHIVFIILPFLMLQLIEYYPY